MFILPTYLAEAAVYHSQLSCSAFSWLALYLLKNASEFTKIHFIKWNPLSQLFLKKNCLGGGGTVGNEMKTFPSTNSAGQNIQEG